MGKKEIDITKLNEAVEKFGSLQKANAQLKTDNLALEKRNTQLKQENNKLSAIRNKLAGQIEDMKAKVRNKQSQLQSLHNQIMVHSYQYKLFCGFMAMAAESPSVTDSLDTLIALFQRLKEPGWYLPRSANEMRSLFIRIVMGDYLKCFRCDYCGARFITNKKPKDKIFGNGYYCPACHNWYAIKDDDSFLEALVSEKQLEDTQYLDKVLEEHEALLPFKAFLDAPCDICHEPVNDWDDRSVKLAIEGIGCGHTRCWNSEYGQLIEFRRAIEKVQSPNKGQNNTL